MVEKPYCKDYPDDSIFNSCQDVWGLPQSTPPRNNVSTLNSASSYEKDVFFVYDDTCDHYNAQVCFYFFYLYLHITVYQYIK